MSEMVLALDLGTKCGWAFGGNTTPHWGRWDLSLKRGEGGGMRFERFRLQLTVKLDTLRPQRVCYELVARHAGTDAAHVYGALQGILQMECERRSIPYEGVGPGQWKKHLGIKGNLGEKEYHPLVAARVESLVATPDEAAAIGILLWGLEHLTVEPVVQPRKKRKAEQP